MLWLTLSMRKGQRLHQFGGRGGWQGVLRLAGRLAAGGTLGGGRLIGEPRESFGVRDRPAGEGAASGLRSEVERLVVGGWLWGGDVWRLVASGLHRAADVVRRAGK